MLRRNYYSNRAYFNTNAAPTDITNEKVTDAAVGNRLTTLLAKTNLSQKDREFVSSLDASWKRFSSLTKRQFDYFETVEKRYDPAVVAAVTAARQEWEKSWDDWKKLQFQMCCKYYSQTPYFRDLANKGVTDKSFIPTQKQFSAMCENKFAKRLIENMTTHEFDVNDVVTFRKNRREDDPVGIVISVLDDITARSANRGGRQYRIAMMVSGLELTVCQSDIKRYRDK